MDWTEADYLDSYYGGNVADNYSAFDVADNGNVSKNMSGGTTVAKASWLDSLQKGLGIVASTAATVAPAALQFINSGKGTPQAVATPAAPVLNKFPETGQANQATKTNYLPWIIGGLVALGAAALVFFGLRRK